MKRNEIDKILTGMLAEKLSEGYTIVTSSLYKGTVVLGKDGSYFGLRIDSFRERSEEFFAIGGVEITFGENRDFKPGWTFWDDKTERTFVRRFYEIGNDWYGTKDEAISARRLHRQRRRIQASYDLDERKELSDSQIMTLVTNKVRNERGWKKCGFDVENAYHYRDIRDGKVARSIFRITVKNENKSATFTYNHFGA